MKAKKLPTLLEEEAIAVWFELTQEQESYTVYHEPFEAGNFCGSAASA